MSLLPDVFMYIYMHVHKDVLNVAGHHITTQIHVCILVPIDVDHEGLRLIVLSIVKW